MTPTTLREEPDELRNFIINMKNGYYGSFEDNYQTAYEELAKLIADKVQQAVISLHTRIFNEFDMLPRIQSTYKGDRSIDVRNLQKVMCDFERDLAALKERN